MPNNHNDKDLQKAFAAHIRNPERHPKPHGIDERRMQVYRDLFFNNISNLIKQTFPVLNSLYTSQEWSALIREFYQKQYNKTPYFTEIAGEFVRFLKPQDYSDTNRPFIYELAHYEWLELAVEKAPQQPIFKATQAKQLLQQIPIISPLVNAHSYQFPVHQIGPDYQPHDSDSISHLMVWRDRHYTVHFAQLNDPSYDLLKQLQKSDLIGRDAILSVFGQSSVATEHKTIEFGQQQLLKWLQQDIITSTQ